jgi:hypothetical protein
MEKVVPFFKYFTTIFYLKFLEHGKVLLDLSKFGWIWIYLNPFEISNSNQFTTATRHCFPGPSPFPFSPDQPMLSRRGIRVSVPDTPRSAPPLLARPPPAPAVSVRCRPPPPLSIERTLRRTTPSLFSRTRTSSAAPFLLYASSFKPPSAPSYPCRSHAPPLIQSSAVGHLSLADRRLAAAVHWRAPPHRNHVVKSPPLPVRAPSPCISSLIPSW